MKEFEYQLTKPLNNQQQIVELYRAAIATRNLLPRDSDKIAIMAFNATHPSKLNFKPSDDLEKLRFELGALEAPGDFSTYTERTFVNQEEFEDFLWDRFEKLIDDLLVK
jgi:hypothetical protein